VELRRDSETRGGVIRRVSEQLGMHPETLRNVRHAEVDGGVRPGITTSDAQRLAELEQENRELRRANHIMRTASAFFATVDRPTNRWLPRSTPIATTWSVGARSGSSRSVRC